MLLIVLAVLGGLALLVTSVSIIAMMLMLIQTIRDQRDILTLEKINTGRVAGIEKLLIAIHTMLVSEIGQAQMGMPPGGPFPPGMQIGHRGGKFVTEDGRHEADTFEELIQKISSDPRYRVAKDEDVDKLREQFEKHARELGEEVPEDDEDETEGEDWKDDKDKEPEDGS
ncbi:hypothetical protein LCGC14_3106970 [marine sediment metagenome]|uniref:Uncharacterized protein n=1 Tax=marine sediment metagenome TaxID=412755 RepID=A0A0F8YDQ2_9ZZZZ